MSSTEKASSALNQVATEAGHWYTRAGDPFYEIVGKNGAIRPVTLRDARKLNLVPGVTSIIRQEAAPALTRWMVNQALEAAADAPQNEGETREAYIERIRELSREKAEKAREAGVRIHASLEWALKGEWDRVSDAHQPHVQAVLRSLEHYFPNATWAAEKSAAIHYGYGCRVDLVSRDANVVIDFKTKEFSESPKAYSEHGMQLAANRVALRMPHARYINAFISTSVPGLVHFHEWEEEDLAVEWSAFNCLLSLWQIRKGLDTSWVE